MENRSIAQRSIAFAVMPANSSQRPTTQDDVTLLSHVSTNKLDSLLRQVIRWNGPVSAAIYITSEADLEEFTSFVTRHHDDALQRTTFHVLFETPSWTVTYP